MADFRRKDRGTKHVLDYARPGTVRRPRRQVALAAIAAVVAAGCAAMAAL